MTPRLTIDLDAIAANWAALATRGGDGATAAVVKADGYGLGAIPVARRLIQAGCRHFFVAHPGEGRALRDAIGAGPSIAVLNGLSAGAADTYRAHALVPVLGSLTEIAEWRQAAERHGDPLEAILHVDTGMSRLGLDPGELDRLVGEPTRLAGLRLILIMTHLVSAETPSAPINALQRARFAAATARLPAAPTSIANSSGIFLGAEFESDLARPGAALYGINPQPGHGPNPMRPVVRLCAPVLQTRWIAPGETVGYNGVWTAARPTRIATLPIGYADGYLRSLTNVGLACFDGRAIPLVGRVSMDLTTWDVTDHPTIAPHSWLELIGPSIPPDDVAARAGTNGYEILTALGRRYQRHYAAL